MANNFSLPNSKYGKSRSAGVSPAKAQRTGRSCHDTFLHSYQAILFDLDGVLVDSYDCWFRLVNDLLVEQGKKTLSQREFDRTWGQAPDADREELFPEWSLKELMDRYDQRFPSYTRWSKPEPGSREFLQELRASKKKVAVASNSPTFVVELLLKHAGVRAFVDVTIGVDQVEKGKPEPDMLLKALHNLHLERNEVCYVGDSIFDEQAAGAAGIFFVGYKRTGDISVQNFQDLSRLL
jgi:HAD superfamily hydrolase (TIGR01509 family)